MKKKCKYCKKDFEALNPRKQFCYNTKCKNKYDAMMLTKSGRGKINAKRYRENNPDYFNKIKNDPERYEKHLEISRKWSKELRINNPEKAKQKDHDRYWKDPEKERARIRVYKQTESGKISHRKSAKKQKSRRRGLGHNKILENVFPKEIPTAEHHINDFLVIDMPKITHDYKTGISRIKHRKLMNAFLKKLGIKLDLFLK